MKRDRRLRGLSSEHHQALVISRMLADTAGAWNAAEGAALSRRFEIEIEPHFRTEEEVLLPALRAAGAVALADRTLEDHTFVRTKVREAHTGDRDAARALGERLLDHVRFEERELFPACEELLLGEVLDEVARRCPKED